MEMREGQNTYENKYVVEHESKSDKYAKKGVGNTALGLSIGALGLMLLNGGLGFNWGNNWNNCNGCNNSPSAFQAWQKECEDNVALTSAIYQGRITELNERFADRQTINQEMFGLYKSQIDADFMLYKGQRDNYDVLANKISELEKQVAIGNAVRPYQDKLIMCEINDARKDAQYSLDRRTCRMISGELVLPSTPTVTGYPSYNPCSCTISTASAAA